MLHIKHATSESAAHYYNIKKYGVLVVFVLE